MDRDSGKKPLNKTACRDYGDFITCSDAGPLNLLPSARVGKGTSNGVDKLRDKTPNLEQPQQVVERRNSPRLDASDTPSPSRGRYDGKDRLGVV